MIEPTQLDEKPAGAASPALTCYAPPAQIRIFRVNDYEWWAGKSLDEIHAAYKQQTGIEPEDPDEGFENPYALDDAALDKLTILVEPDGTPGDSEARKITFREGLMALVTSGAKFPCHFAGTEY